MSYAASFTASQLSSDPSYITLVDSGSGTDNTIVSRNIYIQLANGNYLLEGATETAIRTAIVWGSFPTTTSKTISVLTQATSPSITVDWITAGGAVVTSVTDTFCFDFQDYIFALGLTMNQVANNNITQDLNWYGNKMQLIVNANDAENAVAYADNITLSQNSLDRNQYLINNANLFF
jgi:hypothetical protein